MTTEHTTTAKARELATELARAAGAAQTMETLTGAAFLVDRDGQRLTVIVAPGDVLLAGEPREGRRGAAEPPFLIPPKGGTFPIDRLGRVTVDGEPAGGTVTFTPMPGPETGD